MSEVDGSGGQDAAATTNGLYIRATIHTGHIGDSSYRGHR